MIGDKLRQAREAKQLSIRDAEKETSIRALYIEAIEKGEYKTLPGEAYLRGFIKSYANFLGLDGQALVEEYKGERGFSAPTPSAEKTASAVVPSEEKKPQETEKPLPVKARGKNAGLLKKLLAGVAALLVLGASYVFLTAKQNTPQETAATMQPAAAKPAAEQPPAPALSKEQPEPAAVPQEVSVDVKLTGRCWMQVEVDKRVVYEGTATNGENFNWKGKENVKLTVGNAGAAEISQNGKPVGKLGDYGEVVTKTFTKAGEQAQNKS